ncbi:hypothetical protein ACMDCT_02690 [Halomonadaceae bacterium KBTZ08]
MVNNAGKCLLAGLLMAVLGASAGAEQVVRFRGVAASLDSGDRVYTEHHRQTGECRNGFWAPIKDKVTYRTPEGDLIAEKTVDYGEAPAQPGFVLADQRFGERVEVTRPADERIQVRYRSPSGEQSSYQVAVPENGVIDAGFEVMVRQNWEALVTDGNAVRIEFLAPTRGRFYTFRAEPAELAALEGEHVFRISVAGWVSSWFVDPIHLAFNDQRQLTDFYGLTNILRTPEENHKAHIRYEYQRTPECR